MDVTASRLRALREKSNLSQERVAKAVGVTRTAYNKYENGVIKPVRKLNELAEFFGVSTDYLLGLVGPKAEAKNMARRHENKQVEKYLSLSAEGKELVDIMLNAIYEREQSATEKS